MGQSKSVAILGASPKTNRFSYKANQKLKEFGHKTLLISPKYQEISGEKVYHSLTEIKEQIDTLTIYTNPDISKDLAEVIVKMDIRRVIFNPGAENFELKSKLEEKNVECIEDCTLVMLDNNKF